MTGGPGCPECGKQLPPDAPGGLCPECLIQVARQSASRTDASSGDPQVEVTAETAAVSASGVAANKEGVPPGVKLRYFGDYEILEEIGRGGMGVVYKARQLSLDRIVAVKMIRSAELASPKEVERFRAEAEAGASLQHPHIVAIYEIGEHEDRHYFSMNCIEGNSLAEMTREHPLPSRKAAEYMNVIAGAVEYAHEQGTLHRDLKPSNVLIDEYDRPQVTDFGLAKRTDADSSLTATGQVLGTPSYMAPEQASGKCAQAGPASDVYSLGAMLYELLTGRPPFQAESAIETLKLVVEVNPVPPKRLNPAIPKDLETICLKCLAKDPQQRYHSAQLLAEDLGLFLDDEPIRARRVAHVERMLRRFWKQRRAAALALAAAVVGILLTVMGLMSWNVYQQRQLGRLMLTTPDMPLTVEVVGEHGKNRTHHARFTAPTIEPIELPAGDYRLQVSGDGPCTDTYRVLVERDVEHTYEVSLRDRLLWDPAGWLPQRDPGTPSHYSQVLNVPERRDLVQLFLPEEQGLPDRPHHQAKLRLKRINGTTGETVWEERLDHYGREAEIVTADVDCSGDGIMDVILAGRRKERDSPRWEFAAVSGNEGRLLWQFVPEKGEPGKQVPHAIGDLNGDDTPDLVAFIDNGGAVAGLSERSLIAVCGRTGEPLWDYPLNDSWWPIRELSPAVANLRVVEINGESVVVTIAGSRLVGLDGETGRAAWEPLQLSRLPPSQPPAETDAFAINQHGTVNAARFRDVTDDGNAEAILLEHASVHVFSLAENVPLWKSDTEVWRDLHSFNRRADSRLLVEDLDGEGSPEILVLRDDGVTVFDALSGSRRWSRDWTRSAYEPRHISVAPSITMRMSAGPDLDDDGHREVFVAAWHRDQQSRRFGKSEPRLLFVVRALSGNDGRELWQWEQDGLGPSLDRRTSSKDGSELWQSEQNAVPTECVVRPLQWWHAGPDGLPLLLVTISDGTHVITARKGQRLESIRAVPATQPVDLDADGVPDLLAIQAGMAYSIRGAAPVLWQRLGQWDAAQDFDGDGVRDLLRGPDNDMGRHVSEPARPCTAISGRNGTQLWRADAHGQQFVALPPPHGDLDGDGVSDAVAIERNDRLWPGSVHAISGKTGRRFWTATVPSSSGLSRSGGISHLGPVHAECCPDLNGNGHPDLLLAYRHASEEDAETFPIIALSGSSGKRLWKMELASGARVLGSEGWNSWNSLPDDRPDFEFADVDGDGLSDVIVSEKLKGRYVPPQRTPKFETRIVRGTDGQILFRRKHAWRWRVADVDGDGVAELISMDVDTATVSPIDIRTGKPKWISPSLAEKGVRGYSHLFAADLDGTGDPMLCLAFKHSPSSIHRRFVILNSQGQIREMVDLEDLTGRGSENIRSLLACDVNGDGREEILWAGSRLRVGRGGLTDKLWERDTDEGVLDVQPGRGVRPGTIVLINRRFDFSGAASTSVMTDRPALSAVNAATGETRWNWRENNAGVFQAVGNRGIRPLRRVHWLGRNYFVRQDVRHKSGPITVGGTGLPTDPE